MNLRKIQVHFEEKANKEEEASYDIYYNNFPFKICNDLRMIDSNR